MVPYYRGGSYSHLHHSRAHSIQYKGVVSVQNTNLFMLLHQKLNNANKLIIIIYKVNRILIFTGFSIHVNYCIGAELALEMGPSYGPVFYSFSTDFNMFLFVCCLVQIKRPFIAVSFSTNWNGRTLFLF